MSRPPLPSLDELKAQAKSLRASLANAGDEIGHGRALELIAHQHGFRDWNTLHAAVGNRPPPPPLQVGMRVGGSYLGQSFDGEIVALSLVGERYRVTLQFDDPVDVVAFDSFSNYRSRVTVTVGRDGRTTERTSDGRPHMVLDL